MRVLTYDNTKKQTTYHINNAKTIFLHQSKNFCQEWCKKKGYQVIQFAHWIEVKELEILLIFRHQVCIEMIHMEKALQHHLILAA